MRVSVLLVLVAASLAVSVAAWPEMGGLPADLALPPSGLPDDLMGNNAVPLTPTMSAYEKFYNTPPVDPTLEAAVSAAVPGAAAVEPVGGEAAAAAALAVGEAARFAEHRPVAATTTETFAEPDGKRRVVTTTTTLHKKDPAAEASADAAAKAAEEQKKAEEAGGTTTTTTTTRLIPAKQLAAFLKTHGMGAGADAASDESSTGTSSTSSSSTSSTSSSTSSVSSTASSSTDSSSSTASTASTSTASNDSSASKCGGAPSAQQVTLNGGVTVQVLSRGGDGCDETDPLLEAKRKRLAALEEELKNIRGEYEKDATWVGKAQDLIAHLQMKSGNVRRALNQLGQRMQLVEADRSKAAADVDQIEKQTVLARHLRRMQTDLSSLLASSDTVREQVERLTAQKQAYIGRIAEVRQALENVKANAQAQALHLNINNDNSRAASLVNVVRSAIHDCPCHLPISMRPTACLCE